MGVAQARRRLVGRAAADRTQRECCGREPETLILAIARPALAIAAAAIVISVISAPLEAVAPVIATMASALNLDDIRRDCRRLGRHGWRRHHRRGAAERKGECDCRE